MNILAKILSIPISLIYLIITVLRNWLFDFGFLKQERFQIPVISIGNLSHGGTGKSPHTEYVVRIALEKCNKVAILSRGYKRKTKGFMEVLPSHQAMDAGDEPCQFRNKFDMERVIVAVDERRARGIRLLLKRYPDIQLIVLDDAFQHRFVKAGITILLTDYYKPFWKDALLPFGDLRELKYGMRRADMVVITKSPPIISPIIRRDIYAKAGIRASQELLFSKIIYKEWIPISILSKAVSDKNYNTIFLFTGIANPYPLELYLKQFCVEVVRLTYPDHYQYTVTDLNKIRKTFDNYLSTNKMLITTEKDVSRIVGSDRDTYFSDIPAFYIPIEVVFHETDKEIFNHKIMNYVTKNQRNN